jgi:hypothetical protein
VSAAAHRVQSGGLQLEGRDAQDPHGPAQGAVFALVRGRCDNVGTEQPAGGVVFDSFAAAWKVRCAGAVER